MVLINYEMLLALLSILFICILRIILLIYNNLFISLLLPPRAKKHNFMVGFWTVMWESTKSWENTGVAVHGDQGRLMKLQGYLQ